MIDTVVGAPVWDRAWALPLWFASIRDNVDPATTGLVFVAPPSDHVTREAIAQLSDGFAFVEVLRDRGEQLQRQDRPGGKHATLAAARNQVLRVVNQVGPAAFISWDTDFLLAPGGVEALRSVGAPLVAPWAWLNRQEPKRAMHGTKGKHREVLWQDPACATAMAWDPRILGRARHYPAEQFLERAEGVWRCGVALALQVMDRRAYSVGSYAPHRDGEDIPFNWELRRRGVDRLVNGGVRGVHLYERARQSDMETGWPDVMDLASDAPLAAKWSGPRSDEDRTFGFFDAKAYDEMERLECQQQAA